MEKTERVNPYLNDNSQNWGNTMRKLYLAIIGGISIFSVIVSERAVAADLDGNCCADLEERIAELEATATRKGNRKVSLTVSGWVAEEVMYWDDGAKSSTYVEDLGTAIASRVKFSGEAQIAPGLTAGFVLHLEAINSDNTTTDQDTPDGPGLLTGRPNAVQTYESYWFIKSARFGEISVGKRSPPSDNSAALVDGSGSVFPANWIISGAYSFKLRNNAGGYVMNGASPLIWGATGACFPGDCLGLPFNIVRYDSPIWNGFSFSASWGEESIWDVGLRYSGELNDFKLSAALSYGQIGNYTPIGAAVPNSEFLQVGVYVEHVPTGIFGLVNYGNLHDDAHAAADLNPDVWFAKAGVRRKWNQIGATIPYGEYMTSNEALSQDSQYNAWGFGVVQEIDAAAMSMYLKYRQYSFEDKSLCAEGCKDLDQITLGAFISF